MTQVRSTALSPARHAAVLVGCVLVLGWLFAWTEVQIEGGAGWAANLPTWRIDDHWALDLFWGGRPMTGYHAGIFSFMALVFHLPAAVFGVWTWRLEARLLGALVLFWVVEDALWFAVNPAFGLARLTPAHVPWHERWWLGLPVDYWVAVPLAAVLLWLSFRGRPA